MIREVQIMNNDGFWLCVPSKTAVELFFQKKIDLSVQWPKGQAEHFLDMLLCTSVADILSTIDFCDHNKSLLTEEIPQFAEAPDVICSAVTTVCNCGKESVSYEDLGYYLIREERKTLAYRKYGENYGKGASYLGLLCNKPGSFTKSALSNAFIEHLTTEQKKDLQTILLLRIPLIQELLWRARESKYNGYDSMRMFNKSTMIRRGQCPRWMLPALHKLKYAELDKRINNVFWQE